MLPDYCNATLAYRVAKSSGCIRLRVGFARSHGYIAGRPSPSMQDDRIGPVIFRLRDSIAAIIHTESASGARIAGTPAKGGA